MSSIYPIIRAALETNLNTIVGLPPVAWENITYEPITGQSYIRAKLIPTRREPAVRGLSPQMYYQGVLRLDCYVPSGNGPSAGDDIADTIMEAFEATTTVSSGGFDVSLRYAEREMAEQDGPFYTIPVNIGWYIYS